MSLKGTGGKGILPAAQWSEDRSRKVTRDPEGGAVFREGIWGEEGSRARGRCGEFCREPERGEKLASKGKGGNGYRGGSPRGREGTI